MQKTFDEIQKELQNMHIQGENLADIKGVHLDLLTNHFSDEEASIKEMLMKLQNYYLALLEDSSPVHGMEVENGKVRITDGKLQHRLGHNVDMDQLKGIAEIGVVATEWFGVMESEQEGLFCTFIDEVKQGQKYYGRPTFPPTPEFMKKSLRECTLFFDEKNEKVKELVSLDYFEYQHMKKISPEKVQESYPDWIRKFYEEINDPVCSFSSHFHDTETNPQYTWHAIPGGIPPQFINGICICSISELNQHIEEMKELFPNATIFNEEKEVIYSPQLEKGKEEAIRSALYQPDQDVTGKYKTSRTSKREMSFTRKNDVEKENF